MSTATYDRWRAAGSPFTLCRPLRELRDLLRGYGYTVYDIGNAAHLQHDPPEDHTPYSETGWPGRARYGYGYAVDIMPPRAGSGLPALAALGTVIHDQRPAWVKYLNWEPDGPGGRCLHCSWQPRHAQRASTDRGHIHLSARTGYEETSGGRFDPVDIIRGGSDMDADQARELRAVFSATFNGGSSCGRAVDPDGTGARPASNSIVAKLDYVMGRLDQVAAGLDQVDERVVAGVLAGLPADRIAAALVDALPASLAADVVDELAARVKRADDVG